ncbi:MAG: DEAD/DEAH box helicase [Promethearchaeota archaeon]
MKKQEINSIGCVSEDRHPGQIERNWQVVLDQINNIDTIEYREYQHNICHLASNHNTLVILPTAMGKTIIAVLVALRRLKMYPWGKVIILAPTRPLVSQHVETFRHFLKVEDGGGGLKPAFSLCELNGRIRWQVRRHLFQRSNIIFSTPQTLRNDLLRDIYNLSSCVLLVLDECHKTGERYAYTDISRMYMLQNPDPIILGLTASPGRDVDRIIQLCERLFIERITIRTPDDPDVQPYIHPVNIDVNWCTLPLEIDEIMLTLKEILINRLEKIRRHNFLTHKSIDDLNKMDLIQLGRILWSIVDRFAMDVNVHDGAEGNDGAADDHANKTDKPAKKRWNAGFFFWLLNLQSQCVKLFHLIELISTQDLYTANLFVYKIKKRALSGHRGLGADASLINELEFKRIMVLLEKHVERGVIHPKISMLKEILEETMDTDGKDGKIIIFTQYRDTVNRLYKIIEGMNDPETSIAGECCRSREKVYRPARFVGQSRKGGDRGLSQAEQKEVIKDFKSGKYNILIATRIAEEGLDIPAVRHIIFYEPIPSEIRYIQRKGRTGRHETGNVLILATKGTLDEIFLNVSLYRFDKMKRIVNELRQIPLQQIHRLPIQQPPRDFSSSPEPANLLPASLIKERETFSINIPTRETIKTTNDNIAPYSLEDLIKKINNEMEDGESIHTMADPENLIISNDEKFDKLVQKFDDLIETGFNDVMKSRNKPEPAAVESRVQTDWHALLKKFTGNGSSSKHEKNSAFLKRKPIRSKTRTSYLKRTPIKSRKKPTFITRKPIKKRTKIYRYRGAKRYLSRWICEQARQMGMLFADGRYYGISLVDLENVVALEEIDKDSLDKCLKRGVEQGDWKLINIKDQGRYLVVHADSKFLKEKD